MTYLYHITSTWMRLTLFKCIKLGGKDRLNGREGVKIRHEGESVEVPTFTWWGSIVIICSGSCINAPWMRERKTRVLDYQSKVLVGTRFRTLSSN